MFKILYNITKVFVSYSIDFENLLYDRKRSVIISSDEYYFILLKKKPGLQVTSCNLQPAT